MNSIEKRIEEIIDMKVNEKLNRIKQNISEQSNQNRYMTIAETAKFIKVTPRTIYNYLDDGVFSRIYFGSSIRIDKEEIIDFANRQKTA
ncbi:MAG: helix-turn-helix domain-containing protein [Bacteroidia bacterium]|nr:helix-turn-helix domain-containing protein [Bacteroidia bacterium]